MAQRRPPAVVYAKPKHRAPTLRAVIVRWVNIRTGRRGTIPEPLDYWGAYETIQRWAARNPNVRFHTEMLA